MTMIPARAACAALVALVVLVALGTAGVASAPAQQPAGLPAAQEAFLANLRHHCGQAFAGRLAVQRPGDTMLAGDEELVVHFRECGSDTVRLPFHIRKPEAWDRSRTWMFMRAGERLELRHDHRQPDGVPDEMTMYGGYTQAPGTANQQEFIFTERVAADGGLLGWRVEIVPGERYIYGTISGGNWTWRVDFDLTRPVPAPPAPWGHEPGGPGGGTDHGEVLAVVHEFLAALHTRDTVRLAATLMPEGQLVAVRPGPDGGQAVSFTSHRDFLAVVAAAPAPLLERIWQPRVAVHGPIAYVWTPYDFYRGADFSHCGVDLFSLVRTEKKGWRIAGALYTVEPAGCPPSPLGPPT
jgi:hypothetical protein